MQSRWNRAGVASLDTSVRSKAGRVFVRSFALILSCAAVAHAQHTGDIWVGRSAERQLKIAGFVPEVNTILLPPISGLVNGWASTSPGYDHLVDADPVTDIYPLEDGAYIWLEVVDVDPAYRETLLPSTTIDEPGERFVLGGPNLHEHPRHLVNSNYVPLPENKCVWYARFKLVDTGTTAYADSREFTFRFAIEPDVVLADFDCDGDVDLGDFGRFLTCFNGPTRPYAQERCWDADFDLDNDVDLADFAEFLACFNGPSRPAACEP